MSSREIRHDRDSAPDQLDCALVPPTLMRDEPEEVQSVGMIGSLLQHLSIKRLGPVAPSRLIMGIGRPKIARNSAVLRGRLLIAWEVAMLEKRT